VGKRKQWLTFMILLMLAAPAGAQQVASIIGVARVVRGSFPQPVMVSLQLHGGTVESTYTDGEGRFAFNSLVGNIYHVVINDDSYVPVDLTVNVRPDLLQVNVIQVMLMVREGNPAQGAPGTAGFVVSPADLTKTFPKKAVKEFEHGVKLESEGKAEDAIEHYRKAIQEAPDFAIAHNNLGSVYVSRSDFANAQTEFETSIRLTPSDSKPYFNMANLMLLTGKLDEVDHYLQEGFRKHPESPFGLFVQGSVLEKTGKLPEAERSLRRALELDPKTPRPHLELVNVYLREQRPDQAIAELQKFLQEAPNDPFAPKAREVLQRLESRPK
jgi:Flp pilus assembly protein TadD